MTEETAINNNAEITFDRVRENTSAEINSRIDSETDERIRNYANKSAKKLKRAYANLTGNGIWRGFWK